jgi:glycine/D-amino acid oxidase-like deaminating enzyme
MSEIAIIGAGITGAYAAYRLAGKGHKVVLVDAESLPYRGTSCNPGGINPLHGPGMPGVMADFNIASYRLHAMHRAQLERLSGVNYHFRTIDRLFLAASEAERQQLLRMRQDYLAHEGFEACWLDPGQLAAKDARIGAQFVGGLFTHGNIVVDSQLYTRALRVAAANLGARVIKHNADDLLVESGRVTGVMAGGQRISCSAVILAAGYWTDGLSRTLGYHVPVKPVKGQMLIVQLHEQPFDFDITRGQTGLYQYKDDLYWLGGTIEDPAINPGTTPAGKAEVLDNIIAMLPGIERYSIVEHSTGYRPVTPDELPVVGQLPGYENVYIGTGGGPKGILLSAGIGEELLNLVEGNSTPGYQFLQPGRDHVTG